MPVVHRALLPDQTVGKICPRINVPERTMSSLNAALPVCILT